MYPLDQLLAEIEQRIGSENWVLWRNTGQSRGGSPDAHVTGSYICELMIWTTRCCRVSGSYIHCTYPQFAGDTPEEAAAQALLWILEKERDSVD